MKELKNKNTEFHTYKPKQERSFKVILKQIHATANLDNIKKEIEDLGHTVTNTWTIKKQGTEKVLHMFYVKLCKSKNNSTDIYEVDLFFDCRIKFEPPYFKRQIQCINCQRYGYPKSFCFRKARCVKYARDQLSNQLSTQEEIQGCIKCVLYKSNHPANYKGYMVYKDLQRNFFPAL